MSDLDSSSDESALFSDCLDEIQWRREYKLIQKIEILQEMIRNNVDEKTIFSNKWMQTYTVEEYGTKTNDTMFMAIKIGAIDVVRYFLDHGINLYISGYGAEDYTLVQWATKYNHTEIIKLLIDRGADIGSGRRDISALAYAVNHNNVEIVRLLLENDADTFDLYQDDIRVLNLAVQRNCIENVNLLLEYGADIDDECSHDREFLTPLHSAVAFENVDMVCLLLEHGACTVMKHHFKCKTPLEWSIIKGKKIITCILLTHVIIVNSLGVDIHEDILKILNKEMKNRGTSWERELDKMKNAKICDGYNVSVYDILRANQDEMLKYMRNENIREALKMSDYSDKLYFHMLQNHIKRGLEKFSLFSEGYSLLQSILNNVTILPDLCVSMIFSYFKDKDIKYLVESHKALSS